MSVVSTYSKLDCSQRGREKEISRHPITPKNLISRVRFGSPVSRQLAHSPHPGRESGSQTTLLDPAFSDGIHLYCQPASSQFQIIRSRTQLRTDGVHRRKAGMLPEPHLSNSTPPVQTDSIQCPCTCIELYVFRLVQDVLLLFHHDGTMYRLDGRGRGNIFRLTCPEDNYRTDDRRQTLHHAGWRRQVHRCHARRRQVRWRPVHSRTCISSL